MSNTSIWFKAPFILFKCHFFFIWTNDVLSEIINEVVVILDRLQIDSLQTFFWSKCFFFFHTMSKKYTRTISNFHIIFLVLKKYLHCWCCVRICFFLFVQSNVPEFQYFQREIWSCLIIFFEIYTHLLILVVMDNVACRWTELKNL